MAILEFIYIGKNELAILKFVYISGKKVLATFEFIYWKKESLQSLNFFHETIEIRKCFKCFFHRLMLLLMT